MNKKTVLVLFFIGVFGVFLNLYKKDVVPPSFDADEAAFGYNAYAISETGRDEYSALLPSRLKSFGDYKMPLYTYLSIPFVKAFGLNESSTRMANVILVFLFPFLMYGFVKELFDKENVALLFALLSTVSWGLLSISRQAHEAYLSVFLTVLTLSLLLRLKRVRNIKNLVFHLVSLFLLLFSYQSGRIFGVLVLILSAIYFLKQKTSRKIVVLSLFILFLFGVTDIIYQPKRVGNLLFFNTPGFTMKINELRYEGGSRLLYNKLTMAKKEFLNSYSEYFSPQFLFIQGDENPRFGFVDMGPITALEYVFLFIGLYYLFKKKEKSRFLLLSLLLISPLSGALSWAGTSLTRSLFLLVPFLVISSYGIVELYTVIPKKYSLGFIVIVLAIETSLLFYTWDFYFNHYPKRATVIRAWQSGYRELSSYVRENYDKYDKFYISRKHGQPYIFLLFYMKYPPQKYQSQAKLSDPDEYGFGQVERFDKFEFSTNVDPKLKSVLIGYPEDFAGRNIDLSKLKKIKSGTEEIFWIYEAK